MEYTFTLKYRLAAQDCDAQELVERLGETGCDDALVGVGQPGRLALEFTREAPTARAAFHSALADVKRIVPSAQLTEASPDFVGLTDVADLIGVSRQNMRKLMLTHVASFPAAVHEGSASTWHLAEVLDWLDTRGGYELEPGLAETARAAQAINVATAVRGLPIKAVRELRTLLA